MGFAGLPSTSELFTLLLVIFIVFVMTPFIIWYLRGLGWSPGPITRKAEFEEMMVKHEVLDRHGKKPKKTKKRLWGLFEHNVDDYDSEEF